MVMALMSASQLLPDNLPVTGMPATSTMVTHGLSQLNRHEIHNHHPPLADWLDVGSTAMKHKPTVSTSVLATVVIILALEVVIGTTIWKARWVFPVLKESAMRVLCANH